ncbi:unnamed protein product [Spirodela intermedia]|uniref:Uncharacterized protein n=1 Tax=Spirodela intermedia TaxID=51605 RepID=A0A7I8IX69_SPIIN|nr:unnamed protein product [Spirodela intermedia]CAA6662428.1 unnamed protein product [Spirodela intermedia]
MTESGRKGQHPIFFLGCSHLSLDFSKISLLGSSWIDLRLS